METVCISLGSNLGDRLAHLRQAVRSLGSFGRIQALSDTYETEPVGYASQPWFLNAVLLLQMDTDPHDAMAPHRLLDTLLALEREAGRDRNSPASFPNGPRPLDLDILLYGDRVVEEPGLTIPHPAMHLRRFVLEPLVQLAPALVHPILQRSAGDLLRSLPAQGPAVRRLAPFPLPEEL
jgi:2-amino-4-hydroxy-6-hydroxymethyldihydropteridine diphosphokinase